MNNQLNVKHALTSTTSNNELCLNKSYATVKLSSTVLTVTCMFEQLYLVLVLAHYLIITLMLKD